MMGHRKHSVQGLVCLSLGACLLTVALLGRYTALGRIASPPPKDDWDTLDLELVEKTRSLSSLYSEAEKRADGSFDSLPPDRVLSSLFDVTTHRFSRWNTSYHTFFSNWLLWAGHETLGWAMPEIGRIVAPEKLLKFGNAAECGQVSYVLISLAQKAKIVARQVSLKRHVVMEAWYDNEWHMYDPYFEVVAATPNDPALGVRDLARKPDLIEAVYQGRVEPGTATKFFDRSVISYVTQPPYTTWHWKGALMLLVERAGKILKFAIPVLLILWGLIRLRTRQKNRSGGHPVTENPSAGQPSNA